MKICCINVSYHMCVVYVVRGVYCLAQHFCFPFYVMARHSPETSFFLPISSQMMTRERERKKDS